MPDFDSMSIEELEVEREAADQAMRDARARKQVLAQELNRRYVELDAGNILEGFSEGQLNAIATMATQRLAAAQPPVEAGG